LRVYLILGCQEYKDEDGFYYCSHLSNVILDLQKISGDDTAEIINFFEYTCELFDKPCYDYNKVVNIVNYLYKKYNVISEELLRKMQKFFLMYKKFGIYLILVPKDFKEIGQVYNGEKDNKVNDI